jgi:hypothetical protein
MPYGVFERCAAQPVGDIDIEPRLELQQVIQNTDLSC